MRQTTQPTTKKWVFAILVAPVIAAFWFGGAGRLLGTHLVDEGKPEAVQEAPEPQPVTYDKDRCIDEVRQTTAEHDVRLEVTSALQYCDCVADEYEQNPAIPEKLAAEACAHEIRVAGE